LFDSVGAWLDDHATEACPLYVFGCPYVEVAEAADRGETSWSYPVRGFYGTQAFAVRAEDARSIASWLDKGNPYGHAAGCAIYDLAIGGWAAARGVDNFLASAPSFVQHVGEESVINPRAEVYGFPSWRGREWAYMKVRRDAA
jgi:hypothetical protein